LIKSDSFRRTDGGRGKGKDTVFSRPARQAQGGDFRRERLFKEVIKQPEILTTIQLSAQKARLDKMSDKEIESEIADYRRSKSRK
jgi:hypothetical protein